MFSRRLKLGYFTLEGLNSFGTTLYLYYFYFFTRETYGFGNKANLVLAAANGLVYAGFSIYGGRFAQRFGYISALKLGFGTMLVAFIAASQFSAIQVQIACLAVMVIGMCFTWPSLEALVCEGETRKGVQDMVGIYNIVWAGTGAIGYFLGGAILEALGLRSIFYVPLSIVALQLLLTFWIERQTVGKTHPTGETIDATASAPETHHPAAQTRCFLRMAWLSNPFAYIAINTLVAVMPGIAARLGLSTMAAGFCCSVWCFSRLGAFVLLWLWGGWHYQFRWLLLAFCSLVATFALILMVPNLAVLVASQLAFGVALGLIYYSSLFYSMDRSDTKGEHGGIHEAAIGLGNFAGPAIGAASMQLLPGRPNSGALAVTALLLAGLCGLAWLWRSGRSGWRE